MQPCEEIFLTHLAQTSPHPFLIEVERAEGVYLHAPDGKKYIDMISGIGVSNVGHRHPKVVEAIKKQLDKHLHVMVYGEYIQSAPNLLAKKLAERLPGQLNCSYFVNSGTEANEAALKLAKRVTGRTEIISCKKSYHGSTHGSMSVSGNEIKKNAFRPLLPDVKFIEFNREEDLLQISERTACVIMETVQGDAGVRIPSPKYMEATRDRCSQTGTLLILDEIQCGMGRTGTLFAFEQFGIVPDILTIGKAFGGGLPIVVQDQLIGAIGVGGGNMDEMCAYTALTKVLGPQPRLPTPQPPAAAAPAPGRQ